MGAMGGNGVGGRILKQIELTARPSRFRLRRTDGPPASRRKLAGARKVRPRRNNEVGRRLSALLPRRHALQTTPSVRACEFAAEMKARRYRVIESPRRARITSSRRSATPTRNF